MSSLRAAAKEKPPFPLISVPPLPTGYEHDHTETFYMQMSLIHNCYIRGLNSIWLNAPVVTPKDEKAFAGYALACTAAIHGHHEGEETIIFPFLQSKVDMAVNVEQHEAFYDGLAAFEAYMTDVQQNVEKFDPIRVRQLVMAFGEPMIEHLHAEIPTIAPEKLRAFEHADIETMMQEHEKHIKKQPMFTVFPFTVTHLDTKTVPHFPPIPAPIKLFARYVSGWIHPSYWKFSPFDFSGNSQTYSG